MKTITPEMKSHKFLSATSLCRLMLVVCKDGTHYGFTDLDIDLTYNDGDGSLVYESSRGFMPSAISLDGGLSVQNADLTGIIATVDTGIQKDTVRSGKLDFARVSIYQVNYADLTQGHEVMGYGFLGQVTYQDGEYIAEFRSLSQLLKQTNICQTYSLTCRAGYGDARCGKEYEWINGTITAQATEVTSSFTASGLTQAANYFVPGIVEFLTGQNAGRSMEVTGFALGGVVQLLLPVYYPIIVGDTFRIRIDCPKTADANGCKDPRRWSTDWAVHFRGEPNIPIGDAVQVPGAQI
jgi:uncharacterized phage protein (TIGR02218 family)